MDVGSLRLNWHYVMWFKNFTSLCLTLVLPFVLMTVWNSKTLSVIKRRRRMRNRPYTSDNSRRHQKQISEEGNDDSITPESAYVNLNRVTYIPEKRSDIGKG